MFIMIKLLIVIIT